VNKDAYIVAAGDFYETELHIDKEALIIAVDGGYDTLKSINITPHYVVGDMDSVAASVENENCVKLEPVKDETDTWHAIAFAKEKGCNRIFLYGATGGKRISHMLANVQLLKGFADKDIYMFDREECMFLLRNGTVTFPKECVGYLSVLSVSEKSHGVTERNLKYEVENVTFRSDFPLGVSNEFVGKEAEITVKNGDLLLVFDKNNLEKFLKNVKEM